jgi:hypothetical protein
LKIVEAKGQTLPLANALDDSLEVGSSANSFGTKAAAVYVDDVAISNEPVKRAGPPPGFQTSVGHGWSHAGLAAADAGLDHLDLGLAPLQLAPQLLHLLLEVVDHLGVVVDHLLHRLKIDIPDRDTALVEDLERGFVVGHRVSS